MAVEKAGEKGNAYIHRKILNNSLFGTLDVVQFTEIVKMYIESKFGFEKKLK